MSVHIGGLGISTLDPKVWSILISVNTSVLDLGTVPESSTQKLCGGIHQHLHAVGAETNFTQLMT